MTILFSEHCIVSVNYSFQLVANVLTLVSVLSVLKGNSLNGER